MAARAIRESTRLFDERVSNGLFTMEASKSNPAMRKLLVAGISDKEHSEATKEKYIRYGNSFQAFMTVFHPNTAKNVVSIVDNKETSEFQINESLTSDQMLDFLAAVVVNKDGSFKSNVTVRGYIAAVKKIYKNSKHPISAEDHIKINEYVYIVY